MSQARPAGKLARDVSIDPATNPFADGPARVASGRRSAEAGEFEDALALNVGAASDRHASSANLSAELPSSSHSPHLSDTQMGLSPDRIEHL